MEKKMHGSCDGTGKRQYFLEHWHVVAVFLMVYDLAVVTGSYFMALWLRFDCRFTAIPQDYLLAWLKFAPIYGVIAILVFWAAHLYQSVWRTFRLSVCSAGAEQKGQVPSGSHGHPGDADRCR